MILQCGVEARERILFFLERGARLLGEGFDLLFMLLPRLREVGGMLFPLAHRLVALPFALGEVFGLLAA